MTIETPFLNVEKYAGDGVTKTFGFGFRTFEAVDVVVVAADANGVETTLNPETDYYVSRNSSGQGGTVTLAKAPASGTSLAITRSVPVTQEIDLVNQGEFYAETIEEAIDRLTAIAQDLREMAKRHLTVPITSNQTPEQVLNAILNIAATANQYAAEAKKIYEQSVLLAQVVDESIRTTGQTQIESVQLEGSTQVSRVVTEGDIQESRIRQLSDGVISSYGVLCQEVTWTINQVVESGSIISLPTGFGYMVGRNHLRLAYNGVSLYKTENFEEVGEVDTDSTQIKVNMPLSVGDEMMAWTVPLGRGMTDEVVAEVNQLRADLAELSRKVVYVETSENETEE